MKNKKETTGIGIAQVISLGAVALLATPAVAGDGEKAGREGKRGSHGDRAGKHGPAAMLKRADTNGDGVVTNEEFMSHQNQVFSHLDANADGKIEVSELPTPPQRPEGRPPRPEGDRPQHPGERGPAAFLKRADANQDSAISLEEFVNHQGEAFGKLDANSDGKIEESEVPTRPHRGELSKDGEDRRTAKRERETSNEDVARKAPSPESRAAQAGDRPNASGYGPEIGDIIARRLDANGDGGIDMDEAPERLKDIFDRIDANKDGLLNSEDAGIIRTLAEKRRGRPGVGGGNPGERLMQMDANGDGSLQKDEAPPMLADRFDMLDANSDGTLDKEELASLREKFADRAPGAGARWGKDKPKKSIEE